MGVYGHAYIFYGIIENTTDGGPLTELHNKIADSYSEYDKNLQPFYDRVQELQEKYNVGLERYAEDLTILSATMQGTSAKGWSYDEVDETIFTQTDMYQQHIRSFLQDLYRIYPIMTIDSSKWYILSYMG